MAGNPYRRFHWLTAVLALGLVGAAQAQTFYYDAYGGFIAGSDAPAGSGTYANDTDTATGGGFDVGADADLRNVLGVFTDVSWGTPTTAQGPYGGQSGLALSRVDDGTINPNGTNALLGTLTHFNEPISTGTSLQATDMEWNLALFDNPTDAANAETSGNANAVFEFTGNFTLYNWETANAGYGPGGFQFFNGSAWVPNTGSGECPNDLPAGTLVTPLTSGTPDVTEIYTSDGNPTAATECPDAHIYTPKSFPGTSFSYNGSIYTVEISGFYQPDLGNALTDTFWACEDDDCQGTVEFSVNRVVPVPTLSPVGLAVIALMLFGLGAVMLGRRQRA